MNICIMAGGPSQYCPNLDVYKEHTDIWVGADRGVLALLKHDIVPNYAVGDFDSVTKEELTFIQENLSEISFFPSEKDETDLEIALHWAVSQKPRNIYILGATGGSIDHFLANIQLLQQKNILQFVKDINIYIIDEKNSFTVKVPGSYKIEIDRMKKYFLFYP